MKCNRCWNELEPKAKGVASACGHLFCLPCAEELLGSSHGGSCPLCEAVITKSSVKIVNVLQELRACQLSLCGQEPETALGAALAGVKFYVQQRELEASLAQTRAGEKLARVHAACKQKLQEIHNGYLAAKRKYQDMLEARNALEADNEELKLKYQSKAQQTRKHVELSRQLQEACGRLQRENEVLRREVGRLGGSVPASAPEPFRGHAPSPAPDRVVTTVRHRQVFLGHGQGHSGSAGFGSGGGGGGRLHGPGPEYGSATPRRLDGPGTVNLNLGGGMGGGGGGHGGENSLDLGGDPLARGRGPGTVGGGGGHRRPQTPYAPHQDRGFLAGFPRSPSGFR